MRELQRPEGDIHFRLIGACKCRRCHDLIGQVAVCVKADAVDAAERLFLGGQRIQFFGVAACERSFIDARRIVILDGIAADLRGDIADRIYIAVCGRPCRLDLAEGLGLVHQAAAAECRRDLIGKADGRRIDSLRIIP